MKKSRVFMAVGTLALALTAIFATKANKKFAPTLTTGYAAFLGHTFYVIAPSAVFTNPGAGVTGVGVGIALYTYSSSAFHLKTSAQLLTKAGSTNILYE